MNDKDKRTLNITFRLSQNERDMIEYVVENSPNREKLTAYIRNCVLDKTEELFLKINK